MSRNKFILIAIILFALVAGGLWFFYTQSSTPSLDGEEKKGFFSFFSFGKNNGGETAVTTNEPKGEEPILIGSTNIIPTLRQISNTPIAGAVTYERKSTSTPAFTTATSTQKSTTTTETVLRYIERSNGNIFETNSTSFSQLRISNITLPKLYNVSFGVKGESFVGQQLRNDDFIESFFGKLVATTTKNDLGEWMKENKIQQRILPTNMNQIVFSPSKDKITYLIEAANSGIINVSNPDGGAAVQVFQSPLTEWILDWPHTNFLSITSKADSSQLGYAYLINIKTKGTERLVGDIMGLTTLVNPTLTKLIYSESQNNSLKLSQFDMKKKERYNVSLNTLPEKCVWSKKSDSIIYCAVPVSLPSAKYPEDWYKGEVSFSDYLWKIDLNSEEYTTLLKPEDIGRVSFDMTNLFLSEKENYIYFTNKKDLTLWSFALPN